MHLYQPVGETNNDDDGTDARSCAYFSTSVFLQWPIGSSRAGVLKTLAEGILKDEAAWFEWPQAGGASRLADLLTFIPVGRTEYVLRSYIPQQHLVKISYTQTCPLGIVESSSSSKSLRRRSS